MKLLNIFNWVQSLVESFTFYGGSSSGGGRAMGSAIGGGKPFNPMQQNQPFNPTFGGRPPGMPQPQTMNFGDGRFPQGMPSMPQGLPPMQPGMNQPQGQSMMGLVGGGKPANMFSGMGLPPMPQGMPQSQGLPMQGGSFAGGLPSAQQPQSMPMQSNSFAGGGRPFNPQALQNIPYLMNFGGNRAPLGMGQPEGRPFNPQANQNIPY